MSDLDVLEQIQTMERLLDQQAWIQEPGCLAAWQSAFDAAVLTAERGPQWANICDQAEKAHLKLQSVLAGLMARQEAIRQELTHDARGTQALKAYAPGMR